MEGLDLGLGTGLSLEEDVRLAEVNPVTYETFSASILQHKQQREASFSDIDLSPSTSQGAIAEQSAEFYSLPPSSVQAQTWTRSSDDLDNVSDAESVSYAVCQSDSSHPGPSSSGGMNGLPLHRSSHPSEDQMFSRVKLMCSFGGEIMPRPSDGKLRYVGGETRIITVNRHISYAEFMYKMTEFYGVALSLKYQLPGEDLDALVSVLSDDDMQNMMEEYDKIETTDVSFRLRLFLFSVEQNVYNLGSVTQDCSTNPEKFYFDALNGVTEKAYRSHFESSRPAGELQEADEYAGSITQCGCPGEPALAPQRTIPDAFGHVHHSAAHMVSTVQTFPRAPSAPSSAPSSPPLASRQAQAKQPVVADPSLQIFQDRLNRVSVRRYEALHSEGSYQELDKLGSGCSSTKSQREHHYHTESHVAPDSPRRIQPDSISLRGDPWRPGEVPGERIDFQMDPAWMVEQYSERESFNGLSDARSEVQPPEVLLPQADLHHLVNFHHHHHHHQQQQQQTVQQQQSLWQQPMDFQSTDFRNADSMQYCLPDVRTQQKAFQQPQVGPYRRSHQSAAGRDGVPRQVEQAPTHVEDSHASSFLPRSSHTTVTQPTYHVGMSPSSPRLVVHDLQGKFAGAQHHTQVQRAMNGPTGDQSFGRMLHHFGDQTSRRHRLSTSPPRFRDNLMQSDEHSGRQHQHQHQHQHNFGGSDIGQQLWIDKSLQLVYDRDAPSQTYFSGSLSNQLPAQSGGLSSFPEAFLPLDGQQESSTTRYEMIQGKENQALRHPHFPLPSLVSRMDYQDQRMHIMEHNSVRSGYQDIQDQAGDWISHHRNQEMDEDRMLAAGRGLRRQPVSRNEDLGKDFDGYKRAESAGFSHSHPREDFVSLEPLVIDGEMQPDRGNEWPESRGALSTTLDSVLSPSCKNIPATSNAFMGEGLNVSQPVTGTSIDFDQLSRLPVSMSMGTLYASKNSSAVETCIWPQEVATTDAQPQSGMFNVVEDSTFESASSIRGVPSDTAGKWNATHYESGGPSSEMSTFLGNLHQDHYFRGSESFLKSGNGMGKRPGGKESKEVKQTILLTVEATQSGHEEGIHEERIPIEGAHSHVLNHDGLAVGSYTSMSASRAVPVSSLLSYHNTSATPNGWRAFTPAILNVGAFDGSVNFSNLPIYDQSPLSSTNTTASRDYSLGPTEGEDSTPGCRRQGKERLATGMSVTGRLAEDMVCSVLDSFSKEPLVNEEKDGHQHEDDNMPEGMKGEMETMAGNVAETENLATTLGSPVAGQGSLTQSRVDKAPTIGNEDVEKILEGMLKAKPSALKEIEHEDIQEPEEDVAVAGAGKNEGKNANRFTFSEAESAAIARGLQTIKNVDLEEIRELGSGTFGTVYHGKWRGSDVAIKRIKASCFAGSPSERERLISDFWREASTLGQLHHPNVVAFYGVVRDGPGGTLATVTEYMVNGSLKQVLQKKDRTIDRRKRLLIAMDAAFGMEYLHSKNIVHFDLKCENLLVNMRDPHRPICKVGDFGLSKVKHQTLVSGGVRGTLPWMAPELLSGNSSMVTEKVDVFSFGIVMWELLTGEEPYANMHCGAIIGGIVNNTLRPPIPSWCEPAWRCLMESCWSSDPGGRPSFSQVASELRTIAASLNLK